MAKTYLQLINKAIEEAGVDLDPLTSGEFASPRDRMHSRFKGWVADAWKELQMERNEWEFKTKRATLNISPRIYVENGDRSVAPPADSEFAGNDTGAAFTVIGSTLLEGVWASGTAKAILDIHEITGDYKFNEFFDELTPTPANTEVFRMKGWGRYDLRSLVTDLSEPDISTFMIQSTGGSTVQTNTATSDLQDLYYIPWSQWVDSFEQSVGGPGQPEYFTTTPEGAYDFWPRPEKQYTLHFTYLAKPLELSAEGDLLTGFPEEYEDAIVWKAVMFYAEFDRQYDVLGRATKRFMFYKHRLERNQMPVVSFSPNKYFGGLVY